LRRVQFVINLEKISVGKRGAHPPNDIIFGGRDMELKHALI
jgi:hypothetical protein